MQPEARPAINPQIGCVILAGMARTYAVKSLLLVVPETAQQRGIRAEAPVFVSPTINRPHRCPVCPVTYTPLVYQAEHTTHSQHWHETDGGIYYFVVRSREDVNTIAERTGWLAFIEPIGATSTYACHGYLYGRAAAVIVTAMTVRCMVNTVSDYCLFDTNHRRHSLTAGALAECSCTNEGAPLLMPVCDPDDPEADYAPFTFQVRDGTVFFIQREQSSPEP